ncbi:tetratricopeptide repeat protein [Desulfogranum japonicum]|uniref:tetratricopeptide repeat protein n=1 Tax=Desulfogranum japonicum TaxID=231447 RepID=UPI0003FC34AF|nr:tetratricopeptide repeat protein [Desulfogranum japonicum]
MTGTLISQLHWKKILIAVSCCCCFSISGLAQAPLTVDQRLEQLQKQSGIAHFWQDKRSYPYLDKAHRLLERGKKEQALALYETYLQADSTNLKVLWYRLQLLTELREAEVIVKEATAFLERAAEFGPALTIRGFAYLQQKNLPAAAQDLEQALHDALLGREEKENIHTALAYLYLESGNFDKASALFGDLVELHPDNMQYRLNYAELLFRLKQFDQAEIQWETAQSLITDPTVFRTITLQRAENHINRNNIEKSHSILSETRNQEAFEKAQPPDQLRYIQLLLRTVPEKDTVNLGNYLDKYCLILDKLTHSKTSQQIADLFRFGADLAFNRGMYKYSLNLYERALASQVSAHCAIFAAKSAWNLKDYDKAECLLQQVPKVGLDQQQHLEMSLLHCSLLENKGELNLSLQCLEDLFLGTDSSQAILLKAAQLAHSAQLFHRELDYLTLQYLEKPDPILARNIGYLCQDLDKTHQATLWFNTAYKQAKSYNAGLALVHSLLQEQQSTVSVEIIHELLEHYGSQPKKAATLYYLLGKALVHQKQYATATKAWQKAVKLEPSTTNQLGLLEALRKQGETQQAALLSQHISPDNEHDQLLLLDEQAALYQEMGKESEALKTLYTALSLTPSQQRYRNVSMLSYKLGMYQESLWAAQKVLEQEPEDKIALLQSIYCYQALQQYPEALQTAQHAQRHYPHNIPIAASLARAQKEVGNTTEALSHYRATLDMVYKQSAMESEQAETNLLVRSLQADIAELSKVWGYSLSIGVNLHDTDQYQPNWDIGEVSASRAYGVAEMWYRPFTWSTRETYGELYSRVMWIDNGSIRHNDDSPYQSVLGIRIKPWGEINLILAAESLFSLQEPSQNDLLLRASHSYSQAIWNQPQSTDYLHNYIHTYLEASSSLTGTYDYAASGRIRYGRNFPVSSATYLTPFLYGSASIYTEDNDTETDGEAGVGLALTLFTQQDRYTGTRQDSELVIRLGTEVLDGNIGEEFRSFIGLRISGF